MPNHDAVQRVKEGIAASDLKDQHLVIESKNVHT